MTTATNRPALRPEVSAPRNTGEQNKPGKPDIPGTPKGVLHYVGVGLSVGLFALVLVIAAMVIVVPMLTNSTPYTVLTSSMTPNYPPGTLVIVTPTDVQKIHIGDVITYQVKPDEPDVITHRVIQIVEPTKAGDAVSFVTKGDANSLPDPIVKPVQVRGVVAYAVPYIGWVNNLVKGNTRGTIVPLVAAGLFLYAAYAVISSIVGRRRKAVQAENGDVDAELDESQTVTRR